MAVYMIVCLDSCPFGYNPDMTQKYVGAGFVLDRIEYDPSSGYTAPDGTELKPDDGTPIGGTTTV